MKIVNEINVQGDSQESINAYILSTLPRGKEREEMKREIQEQEIFDKFGMRVKLPNKRVEGQRKRRAREYEAKRQQRINQSLAKRLAKAWNVYCFDKHEEGHSTGQTRRFINLNQEEK